MHYLDSLIDDIEPRINEIIQNSSGIASTIQTSLVAYCWILLDSWVAWNTYRFLLRDTVIDSDINDKWFQTPSSYSSSQIKAIWGFNEVEMEFFEVQTGINFRYALDSIIQQKRNSAAHFKRNFDGKIMGYDISLIEKLYKCLSILFRFEEIKKFIEKINCQLLNKGSIQIKAISLSDDDGFTISDFDLHFNEFVSCNYIKCQLRDKCFLLFEKITENAFLCKDDTNRIQIVSKELGYNLFGNKGYYLNSSPIISTIYSNMKDNN